MWCCLDRVLWYFAYLHVWEAHIYGNQVCIRQFKYSVYACKHRHTAIHISEYASGTALILPPAIPRPQSATLLLSNKNTRRLGVVIFHGEIRRCTYRCQLLEVTIAGSTLQTDNMGSNPAGLVILLLQLFSGFLQWSMCPRSPTYPAFCPLWVRIVVASTAEGV